MLFSSTNSHGIQHGAIVNDLGEMYLYQNVREIHFYLNRAVYVENAKQLIHNMNTLLYIYAIRQ